MAYGKYCFYYGINGVCKLSIGRGHLVCQPLPLKLMGVERPDGR